MNQLQTFNPIRLIHEADYQLIGKMVHSENSVSFHIAHIDHANPASRPVSTASHHFAPGNLSPPTIERHCSGDCHDSIPTSITSIGNPSPFIYHSTAVHSPHSRICVQDFS
jgi:hypothetical protein